MNADDVRALPELFRDMERGLIGQARTDMLNDVGEKAASLFDAAVRSDLGDQSMSNWRYKRPIPVVAEHKVTGADTVVVTPKRPAKGPFKVLDQGRSAYAAGDRRVSGKRTRKRDGAVLDKTRVVKRNTGATAGRGTWDDGATEVARQVPEVVMEAVHGTLKGVLRG